MNWSRLGCGCRRRCRGCRRSGRRHRCRSCRGGCRLRARSSRCGRRGRSRRGCSARSSRGRAGCRWLRRRQWHEAHRVRPLRRGWQQRRRRFFRIRRHHKWHQRRLDFDLRRRGFFAPQFGHRQRNRIRDRNVNQAFGFIDPAFRSQFFLRFLFEPVPDFIAIGSTLVFERLASSTRQGQEADGKNRHHAQCHDDTEVTEEAVGGARRRFGRHINWTISATSRAADRASGTSACLRDT